MGDSYQQIFAIEAAIDIYTQAIELDTDYTYAYIKRGTAYRKLADAMQSDSRSPIYALAMQDLDKAIELDANSPLAYSRRSEINLSLRRKWSALQDARLAVDVGQEFTFAYVVLANVYASRGNVLAAYDSLEDALGIATDRASDYAYAYSLHAELCRRAGAYERAITDANSAMEYDDTYALIYYTLARIALDLEDEDLAIEYLLEGIDHNPISPFAYEQLTLLEVDEAAYEDSFLIFETWLEFGEALELADSEEA